MAIDSILFDLDGTLWNSVEAVTISWQRVIARHPGLRGPVSDLELAQCMGMTTDEIAAAIFPDIPSSLRDEIVEECFAEEHTCLRQMGGRIYPGVAQTLEQLSWQYPLAIVSNCEQGYIECFFAVTGFAKYFQDFESFGATGKEKGENILLVLQRLNSKSSLYVGDIIKDQHAAEYAGIPFVFARYGFGIGTLQPSRWDYAIDCCADLLPLLQTASR